MGDSELVLLIVMPFANGSISSSGLELSVVVLEVSISSLTELWEDNFGLLPDFFTFDFLEVTTGLVFTGSTFFLLSRVTFLLAMVWSSLLSSLLSLTTFSDLDEVNEQITPWMKLNRRLAIPCFPGSD